MQRKDIKVGETYALQASKYDKARPVRVVEIVEPYVTDPNYSYKRKKHSGITVEYLNTKTLDTTPDTVNYYLPTQGPGDRTEVETRHLVHTWNVQRDIDNLEAQQRAESRRAQEVAQAEANRLWDRLDYLAPGWSANLPASHREAGTRVHISIETLLALAELTTSSGYSRAESELENL